MKRSLPDENKPNDGGRSKGPERDPQPILMPTVVMDRPSKVPKTYTKEQKAELLALRKQMKLEIAARKEDIRKSGIYTDDNYQYRHVTLPKAFLRYLPDPKEEILLEEHEYRRLGVSITSGWEHYMIYQPEPNILLLRRTHEMALKLKQEEQRLLAEKEAKEKAKAAQSQATTDSGPSEPSTRPKRSITKLKTTSTVVTNDQQKTNDQA